MIVSKARYLLLLRAAPRCNFKFSKEFFSSQELIGRTNDRDMKSNWVTINGESYPKDPWYNLTPRIIELSRLKLHNQTRHPLNLIKQRIADFMFQRHMRRSTGQQRNGSPLFTLLDNISPVVTTKSNFDSLLIPPDHVSRSRTDTYYLNQSTLLRSHTSAHQLDLLKSGLDAFLVVGDVYRRDEIDSSHYPVFHQLEGVRLFTADELFYHAIDPSRSLSLLEPILSTSPFYGSSGQPFNAFPSYMLPVDKQPQHTYETVQMLEFQLKTTLQDMAKFLFGTNVEYRWTEAYFPFTHPSWELEILTKVGYTNEVSDNWTEVLGCGLMRQDLLENAGIFNKVGYAFGLGLERLAMHLYEIPDIRLFWSKDEGFLHQFHTDNIHETIKYKPVSVYPPCVLDISFWIKQPSQIDTEIENDHEDLNHGQHNQDVASPFEQYLKTFDRDFCDLVRNVAGDLIEQVRVIDCYKSPKTGETSLCYRLTYRDQCRTLTMDQVNPLHNQIAQAAAEKFSITIR